MGENKYNVNQYSHNARIRFSEEREQLNLTTCGNTYNTNEHLKNS